MKKGINLILAALLLFALAMTGCENDPEPTPPAQGPTEWSYTVTFDKNNEDAGSTDPEPATVMVRKPQTTVTRMPVTPPTRPGYIFVSYNTKPDGSGPVFKAGSAGSDATVVTGDMTVYAQWKIGYIVTFSKNTEDYNVADPNPKTIEFAVTTVGEVITVGEQMPDDLAARPGFDFLGWNTLSVPAAGNEDATKFTKDTEVTNSITVYARWKFKGLDPKIEDGTIVHEMPLFEPGNNGAVNHNDGSYKLGNSGILDYTFPTDVGATHENAANYDYFILKTEILSGESGNGTGVAFRPKGANTIYGGNGTNKQPWLSNADGQRSIQDVSGAGTSGGLRIQAQNASSIASFRIPSIIFYKAPRYKVTFDLDYQSAPAATVVEDVIGADDNQNGTGVTSAKWPEKPERAGWYFLGWIDAEGTTVTASTPIKGNVTFKAKWTDQEPSGWMETIENKSTGAPLYGFTIPDGGKLGDYDRITFKIKGPATGRIRAFGTFPTSIYTVGTPAVGEPTIPNPDYDPDEAEEDPNYDVPETIPNPDYVAAVPGSFPLEANGKRAPGKSAVNIKNAVEGLLLTANNNGATTAGIVGGTTVPAAWTPYVLDLKGGRDASYGTWSTSNPAPNPEYKWDDDATGTILIAFGIIPAAGGSDARTYFIKDIVLSNADGTKTISALDPRDTSLWEGQGATAFASSDPSNDGIVSVRTILYYEED
jgi:uncharacterized repeat protein (TIGR02543 family)